MEIIKIFNNISETVQVNDFLLSGRNKISEIGINHSLKSIIKNVNSDGKNSSKFKEDNQGEILSMISYDLDFPLSKKDSKYNNFLTPKMSFRFSPNDSKNLKDKQRSLNTNNVFSLNRIGFSETIEGGSSLTIGVDYKERQK